MEVLSIQRGGVEGLDDDNPTDPPIGVGIHSDLVELIRKFRRIEG